MEAGDVSVTDRVKDHEDKRIGNWENVLPIEMIHYILTEINKLRNKGHGMVSIMVCRSVCRVWRDALPPPPRRGNPTLSLCRAGMLPLLRWIKSQGCPVAGTDLMRLTAQEGHIEVLEYMRENGRAWDTGTCAAAALKGHLETIKWLRERGCPWGTTTFPYAAMSGSIELMEWLRDQNCPWDAYTCACAALEGKLESLKWLRERGCPWDDRTIIYAQNNNHYDVVRWAKEKGCGV